MQCPNGHRVRHWTWTEQLQSGSEHVLRGRRVEAFFCSLCMCQWDFVMSGCIVCERRESKITSKFLTGQPGRMEFPFTEVGRLHEEQFGGEWVEIRAHFGLLKA